MLPNLYCTRAYKSILKLINPGGLCAHGMDIGPKFFHHCFCIFRTCQMKILFFSTRLFIHRQQRLTKQQCKGGGHLYFSVPLLTTLNYSDFRILDDSHVFLIAPLVTTRLLLDEIRHLFEISEL